MNLRLLLVPILFVAACADGNTSPDGSAGAGQDLSFVATSPDMAKTGGGPTGSVVINEVNPNGPDPATDPDWIEIFNGGATSADVSGYTIRDSKASDATALPSGTVIPPGGYLVILCDDEVDAGIPGGVHVPFKLSGTKGDEVHFTQNGTDVDMTSWAANMIADGSTWARIPNGTGGFAVSATPTKGTANMP
jgi:hypothetical protein